MIETQWRYAGFWIRFLAYLVDSFLLSILTMLIIIPLLLVFGLLGAAMESAGVNGHGSLDNELSPILALGIVAIIALGVLADFLYFAWMESSRHQATLGKLMVGIRVVDARGERLTFGRALGRTLGKILSGMFCNIGYIIAGFTERKQALHDMLAGTYVVEKQTAPPPPYQTGPPQTPPVTG